MTEDSTIFEFLQRGSLDGFWYWDIEHPEHEWMNEKFRQVLGYEPSQTKHLAREWQHLIDPDDLQVVLKNFHAHCADPAHPYDQVVRYRHANGKTIWVRCRGIAMRDRQGKPVRLLGAHNEVTALKEAEEQMRTLARRDAGPSLSTRNLGIAARNSVGSDPVDDDGNKKGPMDFMDLD